MKRFLMFATALLLAVGTMAQTNDFYDDAPLNKLKMNEIVVAGEVSNPGVVDLATLPLHSVIVKETDYDGKDGQFIGAYQYEGYSIYDLLNQSVLQKKNQAEFPPIVDLYVEIENAAGEKVVLSWGEIYYPVHRHEILIATSVRRIVPTKSKDQWPLPTDSKLVVASDLFTERNISNPVKITVKSNTVGYTINRDIKDMYASSFDVKNGNELKFTFSKPMESAPLLTYNNVFYGRGMGIHGTTPFAGYLLKDVIGGQFQMSVENLRTGMFVVAGMDGYRCVYTYSEVMNRNDQAELLLVSKKDTPREGAFMLFPSSDFFSDRAIRSLIEVRMMHSSDF